MEITVHRKHCLFVAALLGASLGVAEDLSVNVTADTTFSAWLTNAGLSKSDLANYGAINLSGAGHLTVADELVGYAGDVRIAPDAWMRVTCPTNGLGTNAGTTYVEDGGTLEFYTTEANGYFHAYNRPIHFAGNGVNGSGALRYGGTLAHNNPKSLFSTRLFLDGDAKIVSIGQDDWLGGTSIDMNYHTLDYCSAGGRVEYVSFVNPGHIVLGSGTPLIQSDTKFNGGATNTFTMKTGSGLKWWGQSTGQSWQLICEPNIKFIAGNGTCGWNGPVELRGNANCTRQNAGSTLKFANYITGKGGFRRYAYWGGLENDMYLRLECPTNDFRGGIAFNRDILQPVVNGAIPADGGPVVMTNGVVDLTDAIAYTLPDYIVYGTGLVKNAYGQWKSVTKDGAGELLYSSRVGAPTLNLKKGSLRFTPNNAGFWESLVVFDSSYGVADAAATALFNSQTTPETRIVRTSGYMYENVYSNPKHWQDYTTYIVSGYLWNHSQEDVTWTFALCYDDHSALYVNDVRVIYQEGWTNPTLGTVTLKPGANRIVLRVYNGTGGGGASTVQSWSAGKAFSYHVGATTSKNPADYTAFTAETIKSLFTPTDGTPEQDMKVLPAFSNIVCSADTVIDTAGLTYTAAEVSGPGSFTNGSLVVTNRLTLAAADISADRSLTVKGTFTLGSDAVIDVSGIDSLKHVPTSRTLVRAGSVRGTAVAAQNLTNAGWLLSQTETEIILYRRPGTVIILK